MADSLRRRIRALKEPAPTGKGLIVLRNELIDAALAEMGLKFNKRAMRGSRDFENTYRDGQRAGDRVSLNRGVGGPGSATVSKRLTSSQ
jgi:hypothetical protein